jgi:hypothetical protein
MRRSDAMHNILSLRDLCRRIGCGDRMTARGRMRARVGESVYASVREEGKINPRTPPSPASLARPPSNVPRTE